MLRGPFRGDILPRMMMPQPDRHIYLSPHLDDVVLSCGGLIAQQVQAGERVLVVTFFAASPENDTPTPFARELKERWGGAEDPVAVRRAEDLAALHVLGAEGLHLPFTDCVYRLDEPTGVAYYPTVETIFAEIHPSEATWHRVLGDAFMAHEGSIAGARIYAPLTVGHHVDHLLVQRLALDLLARGQDVLFYEDYPYAGDAQAIDAVLGQWAGECWTGETAYLDETAVRAKGDAVACHTSQISTFWSGVDEMRAALRRQALRVGDGRPAERYWRLTLDCWPDSMTRDHLSPEA